MSKVIWGDSPEKQGPDGMPLFDKLAPIQQMMWVAHEKMGGDMDILAASYHSPACGCDKCVKYHEFFKEDGDE